MTKRLVIIGILLAICIGVSLYTTYYIYGVAERVFSEVDDALEVLSGEDESRLNSIVGELCRYWELEEERLRHLIRHSSLDEISKSVARLKPLAAGADYTELSAELYSIRWQMEHILHSERLTLSNMLRSGR